MATRTRAKTRRAAKGTSDRLSPEDWLSAALDALHDEGIARVKVEVLARTLGVTKGSFYWHFADLPDLHARMIAHWERTQRSLFKTLAAREYASPADRLNDLLRFTQSKDSRHDVGMRAWSLIDKQAAKAIRRVDRARLAYVEELFASLGFAEIEAKARARLLYFYQVGEYTSTIRDTPALRDALLQARTNLLRNAR